jgi:hypothetical protein
MCVTNHDLRLSRFSIICFKKSLQASELELSIATLYESAPILSEMLDYEQVSIEHVFSDPKTGYMLQADSIFIKRD